MMNTNVDDYFVVGCGRCELGGTPACKVHNWTQELALLRRIVNECGLNEESKWGVPCYTFHQGNVVILSAFKEYCSLSFFKGSLLADEQQLLDKPGENSQAARMFKFTNVDQIIEREADIKAYIFEAIELEKAGAKVEFKKKPEPMPEELEKKLEGDPVLKAAFEALTPGRQRGYIIFIAQPKQSATRESRIEKCIPQILNGVGLHDKYSSKKR